ncbi:MAG TPA: porin family protein [Puia sp.]|nr:porin family protein [Puia sp.]
MLNLSDKDLDRLSQEAAQQHEPGDIVGPKFWDKLEARLDRDLGKMNPNPARGIRRLPYYYAPAVLVLLGVTYYLVRLNSKSPNNSSSTSPPLTMSKSAPVEPVNAVSSSPNALSSSPNPVSSDKSNSTPTAPSATVHYTGSGAAGSDANAPAAAATRPNARGDEDAGAAAEAAANRVSAGATHHHRRNHENLRGAAGNGAAANSTGAAGNGIAAYPTGADPGAANSSAVNSDEAATGAPATAVAPNAPRTARELMLSAVRGPFRMSGKPRVDDAGLRAVDPNHIREPIHHGLRINRSLTFGLLAAPDYASVNSLSGQRPGFTFGLTAEYQFANHWYIGTGLLLSRKVFAATPQDYHTPPNYYRNNLAVMGNTDPAYVKGTFDMLEVPVDLRYDFNTGGNLLFFINAGVSSYFFTRESCGYYFTWYNTRNVLDKQRTYTDPDNLFASLNLSLGAELGISNSLSVMVAPYYKIPMRNLGFGQIQLSSVGIDFAIRFAPIISRKRY